MIVRTEIVDVARVSAALRRTPAITARLFAPNELRRRPESLAARYAAKRAVAGILGAAAYRECTVTTGAQGRPELSLDGRLAALAAAAGLGSWHVSITHEAGMAAAVVCAES